MGQGCAAALLAVACLLTSTTATAQDRVALVIGNAAYSQFGALRNPARDAEAMAATLQALDFRLVGGRAHVDVTRAAMLGLLRELDDLLEAGATALVYYSGHGVAEDGTNWLVPVDDQAIEFREDVPDAAVGVRSVLRRLEGRGGGINIVILDACRNNPLPRRRETRGALDKGLGRMNAPSDTVIVYAAAPGRVAYDGTGSLSPFTGALVDAMREPGRRLVDVLSATALAVARETAEMPGGRQEPWLEMKVLSRPFYFAPPRSGDDGPGPGTTVTDPGPEQDPAARAYEAAERIGTETAYQVVVRRYPGSTYAELAAVKIERLERLRAALAPGRVFRDCDACPEMVVVPAGTFRMGSPASEEGRGGDDEGPVHRVTIPAPFAVGKYEVTFAEWEACEAAGGCGGYIPDDEGWGRVDRPVVNVSWDDAQAYVRWLSQETGKRYRLLSESEWEYAARAGSHTRYAWSDDIGRNLANCDGCGSRWDDTSTAPVGSFSPNAFGLHDMPGNVWEWVEDCWNDSYAGAPTGGNAWTQGECGIRVARGGSWYDQPGLLRNASRRWYPTAVRYSGVGFRVARTLAP